MEYRKYTTDGTYWTVRKQGANYWVVRLKRVGSAYVEQEYWGAYKTAGGAGGAAAQLAYNQAKQDAVMALRGELHDALERVGLGVPPAPPPVRPDKSKLPRATEGDAPEE
ncbi:hypothetical protein ACIBCR_02445 [Micromonospora echinospora]|uniref:hypothetical protein n=1 Tax=Micromonospora echinospora TaxID=1877 RepID=UPI00379719A7